MNVTPPPALPFSMCIVRAIESATEVVAVTPVDNDVSALPFAVLTEASRGVTVSICDHSSTSRRSVVALPDRFVVIVALSPAPTIL